MKGTISDWIISAEKYGIDLTNLYTKKLEDYERIKKSGLPRFDDFIIPCKDFQENNQELINFLSKYGGFVIRAIPNTKKLPRRYKIGVKSFEECENFLKKEIKNKNLYNIFLTEYELNILGGIIISRNKNLIMEVGKELDRLSQGRDPLFGFSIDFSKLGHISDKTFWYLGKTPENERLSKNVLSYLDLARDSFSPNFMKGYFEFVVTKTKKVRFLDFKTNEMYLK